MKVCLLKKLGLVLLGTSLLLVIVAGVVMNLPKDQAVISWKDALFSGYSFAVPSDWKETISPSDWNGIDVGIRLGAQIERQQRNESEFCDYDFYDGYVEVSEHNKFSYRKSDGSTGFLLTKDDAYDYLSLYGGKVFMERELTNGAVLVVGKGRYASASCVSSQYLGFIIDGKKSIWFRVAMDEERDDITLRIYQSITPQ